MRALLFSLAVLAACSCPPAQPEVSSAGTGAGSSDTHDDAAKADLAANAACVADHECAAPNHCNPVAQICGCGHDGHCATEESCVAGACQPAVPCSSDKACLGIGFVCNKNAGRCVACLNNSDCSGNGLQCRANQCVPVYQECTSSKDCGSIELICTNGTCKECGDDADCALDHHCVYGVCLTDACLPGPATCTAEGKISKCAADGSFAWVTDCAKGLWCQDGMCTK